MPFPPTVARALVQALNNPNAVDRAERLAYRDAGHGYDTFGMHPDFVALGDTIGRWAYDKYFRVVSKGHENIPKEGPVVLAGNHSGSLPIDGAMMWVDVFRNTEPPRIVRPVADYFVPSLPWIGTLFARCGVVGGSRGNVRALLEEGNLLQIFPEGVPGISKPFSKRYQLQDWRVGHCELAIRHRAPVVPVAFIGPEEQMPQLATIELGGLPIPITATPVPLPVRYYITYGEAIRLDLEHQPHEADDPDVVIAAAQRVKAAVQALIDKGLEERKGVFR